MEIVTKTLQKVKEASSSLISLNEEKINQVLTYLANAIEKNIETILEANQKDLSKMERSSPKYDRLLLDEERLLAIAQDIRNIILLKNPLGDVLEGRTLDNGLQISKIVVPLGVVGVVYEARPNVTFDVFSLCFKSGNALVLKGGSDAHHSNRAIVDLIYKILEEEKVNPNIVALIPPDRKATHVLLTSSGLIDVIIPRGSKALIDYVKEHSKIPVIETGAGIVHTYIDEEVDVNMAKKIILNAKTGRVSVCNALDTLIVNKKILSHLKELVLDLKDRDVELFADPDAFAALDGHYPSSLLKKASSDSFGHEFLSYKMAIKSVNNINEAIVHISLFSSKHSEAIVSNNSDHIEQFLKEVDAAVVYANASTGFTDGAQFEMGAEIGISTQKLHARGPMSLPELTSYKWIVRGQGQIRPL